MNTSTKHFVPRIISAVIAVLLALTVAVPAMGATSTPLPPSDNLTITIHNNTGLPVMKEDMFAVYQLFTGVVSDVHKSEDDAEWNDTWEDYTLADIEWGASLKDGYGTLLTTLKDDLDETDYPWAFHEKTNVFASVNTAAELANVLAEYGTTTEFMQGFAKILKTTKGILTPLKKDTDYTEKLTSAADAANDTLSYKVNAPGYYMFAEPKKHEADDDAESEYIIAVLGSQSIYLKASIPTVEKWINKAEETKGTSADITDTIKFVIKGTLPKNYGDFFEGYEYIFHDYLSDAFTMTTKKAEIVVTIKTGTDTFILTSDQFTWKDKKSGDIPDIDCSQEFLIGISEGRSDGSTYCNLMSLQDQKDTNGNEIKIDSSSIITVEYEVTLNENAKMGEDGRNKSSVILQYSNDPNAELNNTNKTKESDVYVYTYGLDLTKVGSDSAHEKGLGGASFVLKNKDGSKYAQFEDQEIDGVTYRRFNGWVDSSTVEALITTYNNAKDAYDKAPNDSATAAKEELENAVKATEGYLLTSAETTGKIYVKGIDDDVYTLVEVITPAGYNTMAEFGFTIDETINTTNGQLTEFTYKSDTTIDEKTYSSTSESGIFNSGLIPDKLTNIKAPLLPFTGGIGTVIFYVLGGALVAGAIVYIVIIAKNRRKETENSDK